MKSKATEKFWKCYETLPNNIRKKAKEAYQLFKQDPWYPSLRFKRIHSTQPIYSVRVTLNYRAIGLLTEESIIWFWIGSHATYDQMLKQYPTK